MAASAKTLIAPKTRPTPPVAKTRASSGLLRRIITGSVDIAAPTGGSTVGLVFTAAGSYSLTPAGTNPVVTCTFTMLGGIPMSQPATLNTATGSWEATFAFVAGGTGLLKAELFDGIVPVDSDLAPGIHVQGGPIITIERCVPDKLARWGNGRSYTAKGTLPENVARKPRCRLVGKRKVLFADEVKISGGKWSATFNHVPKGRWVVVATAQTDAAVLCTSGKIEVE